MFHAPLRCASQANHDAFAAIAARVGASGQARPWHADSGPCARLARAARGPGAADAVWTS